MFKRGYSDKDRTTPAQMLLVAGVLMMIGCASTEKRTDLSDGLIPATTSQADPYEGFNRSMYDFNMGLDKYVFKPASQGYQFITPDFVETGVSNFFNNLKGINVVLNDVLQGKFKQSASDAGRFLTNTTIGGAGLLDVASELGLKNNVEDFGQTLAVWGVAKGPYLVLPILGPTTIRDGGAGVVDRAANPGTYVPFTGILEGISDRANAEGALKFINEAALDPYVFTRESFLQYRQNLINDGNMDHASYEADLEDMIEGEAELQEEKHHSVKTSHVVAGNMDEGTLPVDKSVDKTAVLSPAFDHMVQSFEQAAVKLDQLGKQAGRNSSAAARMGSI